MAHLTDKLARNFLAAPAAGILWDTGDGATIGFGLRKTKALIYRYRNDDGIQRQIRIGRFGKITVEQARRRAEGYAAEVAAGRDPQAKRALKKKAARMEDLLARFDAEHIPECRPSTQLNYRMLVKLYVAPALTRLRVDDVDFDDIDAIRRHIAAAGHFHQANRVMSVCRVMFDCALSWQMRTDGKNPTDNVKRFKEAPRHHFLNPDEMKALLLALAQHADTRSTRAIKLMLLTGARRGEVLSMKWRDIVDLGNDAKAAWRRRGSDLKQGRDHSVALTGPARMLLAEIADEQTAKGTKPLPEYVFPSAVSKARHIAEVRTVWDHIRKAAKLQHVRLHDLRHTFASLGVSHGYTLPLVGALLGHRKASTTMRYAEVALDPQREAMRKLGTAIMGNSEDEEPASAEAFDLPVKHKKGSRAAR